MKKLLILAIICLSLNNCCFNKITLCSNSIEIKDAPIKEIIKMVDDAQYDILIDGKKYRFNAFYHDNQSKMCSVGKLNTFISAPKGYKARLWFVFEQTKNNYKYIKLAPKVSYDGIEIISLANLFFNKFTEIASVEIYNNNKYFSPLLIENSITN